MTSAAPLRSGVTGSVLLLQRSRAFLRRLRGIALGLDAVGDMPGNRRATARPGQMTSPDARSRAVSFGEPHLTRYALVLCAVCMAGCASPARQILTSANGYHYHSARHEEECHSQPEPPVCHERADVLRRWYTALQEANAALQRGGGLPLQTAALKRVEKESKKWQP